MAPLSEIFWSCLRKYCSFEGRASLEEFWTYKIVFAVWSGVVYLLARGAAGPSLDGEAAISLKVICWLWLPVLPPMVALCVRRMHDMGRSGFWLWLDDNNMASWEKGETGSNEYGPSPEGEEIAISDGNPEREAILREIGHRSSSPN